MNTAHLLRLLAGTSCVIVATAAQAQVTTSGPSESPASEESSTVGEVVVTGSRLQTSGFSAPTPTSVLGQDAINAAAPAAIGDVVNRLPAVRLTAGAQQSQRLFGTGQAPIDLRGLSPIRTLTLVDGNRFTPTAENGTVDSSIIPVSLVERVDVVTGGASAAYGSDAVAGVVNIVLRKNLDGWRGSLQGGVSEHGDAEEATASLAYGRTFADGRGHFIAGGDYSKSEGVGAIYTRDWGRLEPFLVSNGANRPAGVPAQSFLNHVTYSNQSIGGLVTAGPLRGTAFGPGGAPYAFEYGQVLSTLQVGGENERGNPNGNMRLLTPTSRRAALARAEYEFAPELTGFVEGSYGFTDAKSHTGFAQLSAVIGVDNPFLPAATRAEMVRLGLPTITVGRLLADYGGTQLYTSHETLRGIAGLEGRVFGDFKWDVSYQYGATENVYRITDVHMANFQAAVNAVAGPGGTVVCGPLASNPNLTAARAAQVQPGCTPINIFGLGSPSEAALNYVTGGESAWRSTDLSRAVVAANLRGSPFATWAGPVQLAVGGEVRRDTLKSRIDPVGAVGGWYAGNNGANYSGAVTVKEGYVELGVPLAIDLPLAESLDLNAAARYADYSLSGGVSTWKLGANWEPVAGLRVRATRSRDIRAPSLTDLYAFTQSGGVVNITNPFNGASGRLSASSSGNLDLVPEKADTTTIGVVLAPSGDWAGWLRASVDYYEIRIADAITTVGAPDVITRCYAGQQQYCPAITFDNSAFGIANVVTQPMNVSRIVTKGVDIAVTGDFTLPQDFGRMNVRVAATNTLSQKTFDNGRVIDRAGSLQSGGVPSWTVSSDVTYRQGGFMSTLSARYVSKSKFDATMVGPEDDGYDPRLGNSVNTNRFPSALYFDLYTEYGFERGDTPITVFAAIQNLADKAPAQFAATNITSGGNPYDLVGRRFKIGLRFTR